MNQSNRPGPFGRAFVFINRVFGYGVIIGGFFHVSHTLRSIFSGGVVGTPWLSLATGVGAILVGWLYVRSPLSRTKAVAADEAGRGAQ